MTPDDAVLAYDAAHGWHLIPSFILAARYGSSLDVAVAAADLRDPPSLCEHDRQVVGILREGCWTDEAIAAALRVRIGLLPPRPPDLFDQLRGASGRVAS